MNIHLDVPTMTDLLTVLGWRKTCRATLRTSRDLTPSEQEAFYRDVVCNRNSPHRYYAALCPTHYGSPKHEVEYDRDEFVALVSLENISWENGHAEIGLLVDPARRGRGIGREAVRLVLDKAFGELRLLTVWGEAYKGVGHAEFWMHVVDAYGGETTAWARRKFWNGTLHNALLFTIPREGWEAQRAK